MKRDARVLKWSLFAGGCYFLAVATAHMLGFKVPLLFVYFNVPSLVYQDRIISSLAFGWAVFFFSAFRDLQVQFIRAILIAGAGAIAGLATINLVTDFQAIAGSVNASYYWAQTAALFVYWLWLVIFHLRSIDRSAGNAGRTHG